MNEYFYYVAIQYDGSTIYDCDIITSNKIKATDKAVKNFLNHPGNNASEIHNIICLDETEMNRV